MSKMVDVGTLATVASLVLSILAIVLSLYYKHEADVINEKTRNVLSDISADAKIISRFAMSELTNWGQTGRDLVLSIVNNKATGEAKISEAPKKES